MTKHIVLISGSGMPNSHTLSLIEHIAELLNQRNIKTTIWDLQTKPLPLLDAELYEDPNHPSQNVLDLNKLIKSSDGVILGTPVYHGSYSGILKNALDNLEGELFNKKPVGLISNAGGAGNLIALEHLRSVVRSLYGYALQTQIATFEDDYSNKNGKYVLNNEIKKRVKRLVEEIIYFADHI